MRALEFTRLTEDTVQNVDLNRIKSGKPVDPALQQVLATLQPEAEKDPRILNLIKQAVQKFTQKLKQVATAEAFESFELDEDDLGIRAINPQVTQQYDNMEVVLQTYLEKFGVKMNDPKVKSVRDELLRNLQDIQTKEIKTARRAGIEKGYTAGQRKGEKEKEEHGKEMYEKGKIDAKNAVKAIFGDIDDLAKKIVKYSEPDHDAPTNKKAKQQAATELAKQKGMAVSLTAVFLEKVYMEEVLTQEDVNTFVKGCVNGKVLDMTKLITHDHGKIGDFVSETYKDTYTKMYPVLAKFKGEATTGGALGPGEVLLSAIGNPVGKEQGHGDLVVGSGKNAIAIEVKAGSSEKASASGSGGSGARLNGTSIRKGSDAFKEIKDLFKKYKLDATARIPGGGSPLSIAPNSLNNVREQLNNDKRFKEYLKDVCKALVMNFDEVISPNAERTEKGRGGKIIHTDVLQKNKKTTPDVNFDHLLSSVITKDGVDFNAVMKLITYAQLTSYEATDGVQWVMTLDTHTENFSITKDPVDFVNQIGINHVPAKNISISSKDPQTASFHWRSKSS